MQNEDMIIELSQNEVEQVSGAGCCLLFGAGAAIAAGVAIKAALFSCLPKFNFNFRFGCKC